MPSSLKPAMLSGQGWYVARTTTVVCLALYLVATSARISFAQETAEDRTLLSMIHHGLSEPALEYCTRRLELHGDSESLRARWTARLMECHAQTGLRALGEESLHWERCQFLRNEFVLQEPKNPRLPWIDWQHGRCLLLQAQGSFARYLAAPANSQPRENSLQLIREILRVMEELEDDISDRLPIAARQTSLNASQAPADQLEILKADAVLLKCEALLIRMQLYPEGSRDRIAAATEADRFASSMLNITSTDWLAFDKLAIARATARLELGDSQAALSELRQFAQKYRGKSMSGRAANAAIEFFCRSKNTSRARELLPLLKESGNAPEYELAKLRIALIEAQLATKVEVRRRRVKEIAASMSRVYRDMPGYWRNRSQALLAEKLDKDVSGTAASLEVVLVKARQLLAANDEATAIEYLRKSSQTFASIGDHESACQLAQRTGALMLERKDYMAAAEFLNSIAEELGPTSCGAKLNRTAIVACLDRIREVPEATDARTRYEELLRRQVENWPGAPESQAPLEWYEKWLARQGRKPEYCKVLLEVISNSKDKKLHLQLAKIWLTNVLEIAEREVQDSLIDAGEQLAKGMESGDAEEARSIRRLLLAAKVLYAWPAPARGKLLDSEIQQLLQADSSGRADPLLNLAQTVRLIQTNQQSALRRRETPAWTSTTSPRLLAVAMEKMVEAIDFATTGTGAGWVQAAKLDVQAVETLLASPAAVNQAAGWRLKIWLASNPGDAAQSIKGLRKLAEANPRLATLQLQLAHALAGQAETDATRYRNELLESTRLAKRIYAGVKGKGGDLEFAARWRILKNQVLAGEVANAKSAAKLFLASQPMESELWRNRFESFERL